MTTQTPLSETELEFLDRQYEAARQLTKIDEEIARQKNQMHWRERLYRLEIEDESLRVEISNEVDYSNLKPSCPVMFAEMKKQRDALIAEMVGGL